MWNKKIIVSARMWSTTPISLVWALTFRQHSTVSTTSSLLMDPIITHPAVAALQLDKRPRAKLKERHKHLFQPEQNATTATSITNNTSTWTTLTLLNELGTIACETGVVPRKELFETYAAALYMQDRFPQVQRVADLAGGHGLLSWFLLVLDPTRTRSAVVVDRCMPDSAEIIAQAMLHRFPDLESQWTYVVADLSGVEAHPSTLLASVHACGSLSDYLIQLSVGSGAPLAVAPCCHTVQATKGYRPHVLSGMDAESVVELVNQNKKSGGASLADVVDGIRCHTLEQAGFLVQEAMLPSIFTEKNRLILAQVDSTNSNERVARMKSLPMVPNQPTGTFFERKARAVGMPKVPKVRIPLADDPTSIAACRAIGGKEQAAIRLMQTIPRHYSPCFELSVFLPPTSMDNVNTNDNIDTPQEVQNCLQKLASKCCCSQQQSTAETILVECHVQRVGDVHVNKSTGRMVQTYRLEYRAPEGTSIEKCRIPKEWAKEIHQQLLQLIQSDLGLDVR